MIVYDRGLKPEIHLDQGILVRTKVALARFYQVCSTRECVESTFPREVLLSDVMKKSTSPKLWTAPREMAVIVVAMLSVNSILELIEIAIAVRRFKFW